MGVNDTSTVLNLDEQTEVVEVTGETPSALPTKTQAAVIEDAKAINTNLVMTLVVFAATVVSISVGNADMNLTVLMGGFSFLLALQTLSISGKNVFRFIKFGFQNHKPIPRLHYAFLLSAALAYINGHAALRALEIIETPWWG
jgi:hypothetical protein